MKTQEIKTYIIMVSTTYPFYHSKRGQNTDFKQKIEIGIGRYEKMAYFKEGKFIDVSTPKIHTFRKNYELWKQRIDEVLSGKAVISLRYHTLGKYIKGNKQIEFLRLDKDSGMGIQESIYNTNFDEPFSGMAIRCEDGIFRDFPFYRTAENDGLTEKDFSDWFEKGKYDLGEPMACIHFTSFRYGKSLPSKK